MICRQGQPGAARGPPQGSMRRSCPRGPARGTPGGGCLGNQSQPWRTQLERGLPPGSGPSLLPLPAPRINPSVPGSSRRGADGRGVCVGSTLLMFTEVPTLFSAGHILGNPRIRHPGARLETRKGSSPGPGRRELLHLTEPQPPHLQREAASLPGHWRPGRTPAEPAHPEPSRRGGRPLGSQPGSQGTDPKPPGRSSWRKSLWSPKTQAKSGAGGSPRPEARCTHHHPGGHGLHYRG